MTPGVAPNDLEVILNTTKRLARVLTVVITSVLLLGCTPEQLKTYQAVTGDILSPQREVELLALDDHPMKLSDGSVIELNGSVTPPTPCDVEKGRINSLTYNYDDPTPAMDAARTVARCRGWNQAQIDSWQIALQDIMRFESGFCPNVLNGARMAGNGAGCVLSRQGRKGDSGFGQLISIHYRPGAWLCSQEGLCSKWDVIATPWSSMTALVAMIERSGTAGYCYNSGARRLHRATCNNPGLDV